MIRTQDGAAAPMQAVWLLGGIWLRRLLPQLGRALLEAKPKVLALLEAKAKYLGCWGGARR